MNIRVLLASHDTEYLSHLSDILRRTTPTTGDVLEIATFTDEDRLESILTGHVTGGRTLYHIALVDDSMVSMVSKSGRVSAILSLTDDSAHDGRGHDAAPSIQYVYKFQRISDILKLMLEAFLGKRTGSGRGIAAVVAFYSPTGGCGTSTMAASMALAACGMGIRPLFVSFENFNTTELFFSDNEAGRGLHDVFAHMYKEAGAGIAPAIDLMKARDASGVSFLKKFTTWGEVSQIKSDDIEAFIDESRSANEIDLVILDLGTYLGGFTERALHCADEIFLISAFNDAAKIKMHDLLDEKSFFSQDCLSKSHLVYNKTSGNGRNEFQGFKSEAQIPSVSAASSVAIAKAIEPYVRRLVNPSWKKQDSTI